MLKPLVHFILLLEIGLLAVGLNVFTPAHAQSQADIVEHLPQWLSDSGTPSAAIGFIDQGELKWTHVDGLRTTGYRATVQTRYNIASLTKPISAELAHIMFNSTDLSASTLAREHFVDPDIAHAAELDRLSLHHLLSHQSGFPNWRHQTDNKLKFRFSPGTRSEYSGEGYQYLARVIENHGNIPFDQRAHQQLFSALNMYSTFWVPKADKMALLAHPKGPEGFYGKPSISSPYNAADDLYTTIEDYSRFVVFAMQQYLAAPQAARWQISHDQVSRLCPSQRLSAEHCPDAMGFSEGWVRFDYPNLTLFMQGGGDWGERAIAIMLPEQKRAMVVFTNGAGGMKVINQAVATLLPHPGFNAFIAMQAGE